MGVDILFNSPVYYHRSILFSAQRTIIMPFLEHSFKIFSICGCWVPESIEHSKYKSIAFKLYGLTILTWVLTFSYLRTVVVISLPDKSVENIAASTIAYFETFCTVFKAITIYKKRIALFQIRRIFGNFFNKNTTKAEMKIQNDVDDVCK